MRIPSKMQDILDKHKEAINEYKFDVVYQDLYDACGRTYIELFNELLNDAAVENKAPLYVI